MQLSYNNQSLLATGCYEENDPGITRMGKEVIKEMNRVEWLLICLILLRNQLCKLLKYRKTNCYKSCQPSFWHSAKRNKSNNILSKLAERRILGFSLYPHHLNNSSNCS